MEASPAPDEGWGWLVVAGRCVMQMVFGGLERGYGVLYILFLERYGSSASITAWLGSFQSAVRLMGGIGVSLLVNRFGERRVAIAGGLLYTLGFVLSAFVPNIGLLFLTFGVLGGAGASLAYTPPYVLISKYFDKRIGLANSLAAMGSGIGILTLPVLINYLLKVQGYSGCMLSLGGVALHLVVSGALYSPVSITQKLQQLERKGRESCVELQPVKMCTEKLLGDRESVLDLALETLTSEASAGELVMKQESVGTQEKLGGSLKSVFSGSQQMRPRLNSAFSVNSVGDDALMVVDNAADNEGSEETKTKTKKKLFDAELLRDTDFLMFSVTVLFSTLCLSPFGTLLPAAAQDDGVPIDQGVFLVSALGASDFVSRLLTGIFFDLKAFKPYRGLVWSVSLLGMGLACYCVAAARSLWSYVLASILFGANCGVYIAQRPTILRDVVGVERMGNAFGMSVFSQGLGYLSAAPIAGALKDATGSYSWSFVFVGSCGLVGGVLFSTLQVIRIRRTRRLAE